MRCETCHSPLTEDASFCVQCGTQIRAVQTGRTRPLARAAGQRSCERCDTLSPPEARYCVGCGAPLAPQAPWAPGPVLAAPAAGLPGGGQPLATLAAAHGQRDQLRFLIAWGSVMAGVFALGMATLFIFDLFWPGVLVLGGTMICLFFAALRQLRFGLLFLAFMIGLASLFYADLFWPWILVLGGGATLVAGLLFSSKLR